MPEPDFTIKRNDTASVIASTLENSGGTAVDIQGATILFKMASISGGTLIAAGTASILQVGDGSGTAGAKGKVSYAWTTTDTATAGWYAAEWEVTYSSGTVQTFPNGDPVLVRVMEDIGV